MKDDIWAKPLPPAIVQQQRERQDRILEEQLKIRLSQHAKAIRVLDAKRARILGDVTFAEAPDYTGLEDHAKRALAQTDDKAKARAKRPMKPARTGILVNKRERLSVGPNPVRMNKREREKQQKALDKDAAPLKTMRKLRDRSK